MIHRLWNASAWPVVGKCVVLAAGLGVLWAAAPAAAQTNTLASAGAWEAFGGRTKDKKQRICGVSYSAGGRYFSIKYYSGDKEFTVQLGSKEWTVDDGAKITLFMSMDGASPWKAVAKGMHFSDGDAGLEFEIDFDKIDQFVDEFRAANQMRVRFDGQKVSPWQVSLSGTNAVSSAMLVCLRNMD
ncbi:MAG: hypothetical protein EBY18_18415 [Alphaproteobacteria bacterium]|nr:hypothetical protein [Alphaproteobacteria bacterium]